MHARAIFKRIPFIERNAILRMDYRDTESSAKTFFFFWREESASSVFIQHIWLELEKTHPPLSVPPPLHCVHVSVFIFSLWWLYQAPEFKALAGASAQRLTNLLHFLFKVRVSFSIQACLYACSAKVGCSRLRRQDVRVLHFGVLA